MKKSISVLLCACLLLSLTATTVFAQEGTDSSGVELAGDVSVPETGVDDSDDDVVPSEDDSSAVEAGAPEADEHDHEEDEIDPSLQMCDFSKEEGAEVLYEEVTETAATTYEYIWPVKGFVVTKGRGFSSKHTGNDITSKTGNLNIYAIKDGVVVRDGSGCNNQLGL